ncbi:Trm112 family protein [Nocardioides sp. GY 10113]|nr:Trm112 family protein [Nocardioides sp. GY 10113]
MLAIIVCPACHGELAVTPIADDAQAGAELVCGGCGLAYPVRDGIPVLLVDEARKPA